MHILELDDYTYESLMKYAAQAGKTPVQWLKDVVCTTSMSHRPEDKGEPITAENQNFPDLSAFRKSLSSEKKYDEGLQLSDAFFESLENIEKPRSLLELIGKGKGCFKSTAEIDSFIREERDAWED